MRFFFYGSLLDPAIRRAVMGPRATGGRVAPALLEGWRRRQRWETIYPILLRSRGAVVDGVVVDGLDPVAAARLTAFEGSAYQAVLLPVRLASGGAASAYVFLPNRRLASPSAWSRVEWSRGRQRRALRLAHAEMARDGRIAMGRLLTAWRRRAALSQ